MTSSSRPSGRPAQSRAAQRPVAQQWRSGIAAWLGWTFDGLEMHLYTLVEAPFVAEASIARSRIRGRGIRSVPKVSTSNDNGRATPMA